MLDRIKALLDIAAFPGELEEKYNLPRGSVTRDIARDMFQDGEVFKLGRDYIVSRDAAHRKYGGKISISGRLSLVEDNGQIILAVNSGGKVEKLGPADKLRDGREASEIVRAWLEEGNRNEEQRQAAEKFLKGETV